MIVWEKRCENISQFLSTYGKILSLQIMCDTRDASLNCEGNNRHQRGKDIPDNAVTVLVSTLTILLYIQSYYTLCRLLMKLHIHLWVEMKKSATQFSFWATTAIQPESHALYIALHQSVKIFAAVCWGAIVWTTNMAIYASTYTRLATKCSVLTWCNMQLPMTIG